MKIIEKQTKPTILKYYDFQYCFALLGFMIGELEVESLRVIEECEQTGFGCYLQCFQ